MKRPGPPSIADLAFFFIAPIFSIAGAVRLTQSDGDLAAHVRMGEYILTEHRIPTQSLGSYTAATDPLVAPAWLSEVIFAFLFRVGGLPLVVVTTGLTVALTHSLIAAFLRRRGIDPRIALATAMASLLVAAIHWLARPHMFSILAAALTLILLEWRGRYRAAAFFLLFAVWSNLHGGWLYGLLVILAYVAGALVEARGAERGTWQDRAGRDAMALAAAFAGTLCNPYFIGLHREVAGAVTSESLSVFMDEYQPPRLSDPESIPFFAAVIAGIVLLGASRRRPPWPWVGVMILSTVFGLKASRNIALFAVTALPLVALHLARTWATKGRGFPYFQDLVRVDASARSGRWALPVAALLLLLGLNRGRVSGSSLIDDRFDPNRFPVEAVERIRAAGLDGRVFHPWLWGGYLLYAWPGSSIHVDPLEFSQLTIDSHTTIESTRPGWRRELARWNVEIAILERGAPLADSMAMLPGWTTWHSDTTAVVMRRLDPGAAAPSPGT